MLCANPEEQRPQIHCSRSLNSFRTAGRMVTLITKVTTVMLVMKVIMNVCFVDCASLYNPFQMKPTRCTLLLSIFISTSLHVLGNYVPIITRTYCIYATLIFFTLYGWLSGRPTRQPPIQSEKYQC